MGVPQNGMVYIMENPIEFRWFGGIPISGNFYMPTKHGDTISLPKNAEKRGIPLSQDDFPWIQVKSVNSGWGVSLPIVQYDVFLHHTRS